MMDVIFGVDFVAGQDRPRITTRGKYPRLYDTHKSRTNKQVIAAAYVSACRKEMIHTSEMKAPPGTPIQIIIKTHRQLPKSVRHEPHDIKKPDADNVAKLVMDALTGVAYDDDSQVVKLGVVKCPRERRKPLMTIEVIWSEDDRTEARREARNHEAAHATAEARLYAAAAERAKSAAQ